MKILLVEDDIDLNETIKEFLEDKYKIISVFMVKKLLIKYMKKILI